MYTILDTANKEDIIYILENPWDLTKSEWSVQNENDLNNTLSFIENKLDASHADGFLQVWKTLEGQTIAILGFYNVGQKIYETIFIASKYMDDYALKISLDLRDVLQKKESTVYKGCACRLYSTSDHPKQVRWFNFIGFQYLPHRNVGNSKYFEYISKS